MRSLIARSARSSARRRRRWACRRGTSRSWQNKRRSTRTGLCAPPSMSQSPKSLSVWAAGRKASRLARLRARAVSVMARIRLGKNSRTLFHLANIRRSSQGRPTHEEPSSVVMIIGRGRSTPPRCRSSPSQASDRQFIELQRRLLRSCWLLKKEGIEIEMQKLIRIDL